MKTIEYKCGECHEHFYGQFEFIEHQNIHTGETPFMCLKCGRCFNLIRYYVEHIKSEHFSDSEFLGRSEKTSESIFTHSDDNKNVHNDESEIYSVNNICNDGDQNTCDECFKVFLTYDALKQHRKTHKINDKTLDKKNNPKSTCTKSKIFKYCCNICKIKFKSSRKYRLHKKEMHCISCKNCGKNFSTNEKLQKHTCLRATPSEGLMCSCSKLFTVPEEFKIHVGTKPFTCCSCLMKFNTFTNLVSHIRTHTKQKPFVCKDCGRGFSQSAHLKNHSSVHLGISAVKCTECDFSCKTFNGLLKHKQKHKEGHIEQNYIDGRKKSTNISSCPVCNKQFLFKRNMGMHMKIHSDKISLCNECGKVFNSKSKLTSHYNACHREPSVCKTCGKVFASAVLLSAHKKIHVPHKSFSCNICQKKFTIKNYLAQHMKTHSNKKQYSCNKCGKLFKVAVSLKYHSNICISMNNIT